MRVSEDGVGREKKGTHQKRQVKLRTHEFDLEPAERGKTWTTEKKKMG